MKPTKIEYTITKEDLPILQTIYDLDDSRTAFFPEDFNNAIERDKYSAQCGHKTYEQTQRYWIQEFQEKSEVEVTIEKLSIFNWFGCARLVISTETLLSDDEQNHILTLLNDLAEDMLKTKTIAFDVSNLKSFKYALSLGDKGIEVFEEWLYGNVFAQTEERLGSSMEIRNPKEGVYQFEFLNEANEDDAKTFVYEWLEDEMIGWLKQDALEQA